ncbi:MAG: hypothetical protein MH219_20640 [Marinobacter sp.]|nr:hypothetical protein [Marinobacter sp.]
MLFAGALHVNLDDLADQKWLVALLATLGVVVTTFLVGCAMWVVLGLAHYSVAVYLLSALRRRGGAHRPCGGVGHS